MNINSKEITKMKAAAVFLCSLLCLITLILLYHTVTSWWFPNNVALEVSQSFFANLFANSSAVCNCPLLLLSCCRYFTFIVFLSFLLFLFFGIHSFWFILCTFLDFDTLR